MTGNRFQRWPELWQQAIDAVRARGGTASELVLQPPLSRAELALLGPLPPSLHRLLGEFAAGVEFRWRLPDDGRAPAPLDGVGEGGMSWTAQNAPGPGLAFGPPGPPTADAAGQAGDPCVALADDPSRRLGDTFVDFLDRWSLLGCPALASATVTFRTYVAELDPFCDHAMLWRRWLPLHPLRP